MVSQTAPTWFQTGGHISLSRETKPRVSCCSASHTSSPPTRPLTAQELPLEAFAQSKAPAPVRPSTASQTRQPVTAAANSAQRRPRSAPASGRARRAAPAYLRPTAAMRQRHACVAQERREQQQQQQQQQQQRRRRRRQQQQPSQPPQAQGFAVRAPWTQQIHRSRDLDATRPDNGMPVDPVALRELSNQAAFDRRQADKQRDASFSGTTLAGKAPAWRKPRNIHKLFRAPVDSRAQLRQQHHSATCTGVPSDQRKVQRREQKLLDSEIEVVQGLACVEVVPTWDRRMCW